MSSTTYKVCSQCGAQMERRENIMTTSHPAQYIYDCPRCGSIEYDSILYPCDLGELATQSRNEVDLCDKTDYKKKYEEALKRARAVIDVAANQGETQAVIETIFPELRESEDEKIREQIEQALIEHDWSVVYRVSKEDCLAWLEKRSEENIKKIRSEEYTEGYTDAVKAYKKWEKEQKPKVATATLDSEKQNGQKQIKWTDLTWKDIVELEGIINNVHYDFSAGIGQESFGKEVLERFRSTKGIEYLDEAEQKYWREAKQKEQQPESASASIMIPSCWEEKQKENPRNAISIPADCASNAKCPYKINGDEDFIGDIKDTPAYHFGFDEGVRSEREKQKPVDYDHEMWKNCEANFEGGKKEVIDHPEKYGLHKEQKPEWNEKDERNFEWFDKFFRAESVVAGGRDIPQDKYLWFKSLRPQPKCLPGFDEMTPEEKMNHPLYLEGFDAGRDVGKVETDWKPSEEQMEEYNYWYRNFIKSGLCSPTSKAVLVLGELLEQLKKLMEE